VTKRKKSRKPVAPAKFKVGDKVRVKHGIRDTEYPDMPIGGWAGTVAAINDGGMYTVRWSRETLDNIHPVYKKRSKKDRTVLEEYWLGDDDLEPDSGGPLDIEQPTEIKAKPLSPKDQDDRIRMVFGLTSNDPLPHVGDETLLAYYKHLSENLRFPFKVDHFVETGPFERKKHTVTVLKLFDPANDPPDETDGLICEARRGGRVVEMPLAEFEVDEDAPGLQMLADYCYWFWNTGTEPDDHEAAVARLKLQTSTKDGRDPMPLDQPSAVGPSLKAVAKCGLLGAFYGIVVGAALKALAGAEQGVLIGGGILGVLGALFGMRYGLFFGALNQITFGSLFGGVVGAVNGALLGGLLGVIVTAWLAAIPGAILGSLIVTLRRQGGRQTLGRLLGAIAGAGIGTGILAFHRDYARAAEGTIYGGTIGAAAGVVLFLALVFSLNLLPSERNR
jgi:uncharacterized protein YodC (DUF2158 family)